MSHYSDVPLLLALLDWFLVKCCTSIRTFSFFGTLPYLWNRLW